MKIKNKPLFALGILILFFLFVSAFIYIKIDSGTNFIRNAPLLGIIIFYNPVILAIYILIALFLIYKGIGKKIRFT